MCQFCFTRQFISRRQFIALAGAAVVTSAAAACTPARPVTKQTLQGHQRPLNDHAQWPTLAGSFVSLTSDAIILAAPFSQQAIPLAPQLHFVDTNGQRHKKLPLKPGESLLVWLDATGNATQAQRIPPISALDGPIPTLPQPAPTGETQALHNLEIITRSGWGAAAYEWAIGGESGFYDAETNPAGWRIYDDPLAAQLHTLVVHHSALDFDLGPQSIQALHMRHNAFADIGYHFVIDGLGQLYEGRSIHVRGAHTGGHNTGYVGVCLLGNFEEISPIQAQWDTLRQLTSYLQTTYTITNLGGHLDYQPGVTVCPGANLHPHLPQLARELGLIYDAG
ncbi:MAG: N-acetylmuramoyl-L-alanine amidase [Anaerolineales bacterium]|nr:N-acetylmuramoyl-L-alanine amidase [Anaerolineales bacterium]